MIRKAKKIKGEPVEGYRMFLLKTARCELIGVIHEELAGRDEEQETEIVFQIVKGGQLPYSRWCNN